MFPPGSLFTTLTAGRPVAGTHMAGWEHILLLACIGTNIYMDIEKFNRWAIRTHKCMEFVTHILHLPDHRGVCDSPRVPLPSAFSQSGSQQTYPTSNRRLTARRKLLEEAQEGSKASTGCKVAHPSRRLPGIPAKLLFQQDV